MALAGSIGGVSSEVTKSFGQAFLRLGRPVDTHGISRGDDTCRLGRENAFGRWFRDGNF